MPRGESLFVRHSVVAAVNRPRPRGAERYHSPMLKAMSYEQMIGQIGETIASSADRINGLSNNVNRAINVLTSANPKGLTAQMRDVLLSFEALCLESLRRTAWLLHDRHEHDGARQCLEVGRMLQEAVEHAIQG